jgi:hypothetical protein
VKLVVTYVFICDIINILVVTGGSIVNSGVKVYGEEVKIE